jgi:hypothetical protein
LDTQENAMQRDDILNLLHRRPFRPFRITVSTGDTFDVTHPDQAIAAHRFVAIGVPRREPMPEGFDNFAWVTVLQIVHIQKTFRDDYDSIPFSGD